MSGLALHVHRWEPGTTSDAPALLLLHGTGGNEQDLVPLARMVAPGAALLGVRGNVNEEGALRFFRRLAEGVFDLEDLHRRTGELAAFVRAACLEYGVAQERLFALGFSNGANIAASLLLSDPGVLGGAALVRAMVPFEPGSVLPLERRPVLLSQGRSDPLIPRSGSERLAALLTQAGAAVEVAWQDAGHGLVAADVTAIRGWLQRNAA